ncbi:MAG: LacI family transcriptional regulator [Pseudonocardiales bacterium]|nr:MAG: LacI family transcriptional regulator [Pseudonocardiales bacterium]
MRQVGAQVGVSAMTVSRALHDDPRVAPRTRERILTAARELGYRRNELARSLRLGRPSGMLGLVVTNLANPFYSQLALGVENLAAAHGMRLVLSNTADDVDRERRIVHDLVSWRVDGIIVVPAGVDQSHLDLARLNDVPVVLAARPPVGIEADCVLLDDFGGARDATSDLLAAGHRRLAFLGPPAAWTSAERMRGFRAALGAANASLDESLVRCDQRDAEAAERVAAELLAMPAPPTAIFCANSRNAIGAFRAVRGMGTDTELSCFDDFELADVLRLTVVTYDPRAVGAEAARLLVGRIARIGHSAQARPQRTVLPTTVINYRQRAGARL